MKLTTANLRQLIKEELEAVIAEANSADIDISRQNLLDRKLAGEFDYLGGEADFMNRYNKLAPKGRTGEPGVDGHEVMNNKAKAKRAAQAQAAQDAQDYKDAKGRYEKSVADYIKRGDKLSNDIKGASSEQKTKLAQVYNEMFPGAGKAIGSPKADPARIAQQMADTFSDPSFFRDNENLNMFVDFEIAAKKVLNPTAKKKPGFFSRFFKEE